VGAVVVQSPNFLGVIERVGEIAKKAHEAGTLCVQGFNAVSLGVLKRPGEMDVDVAVGEGQPLGIPLQFGGPYLGLFACKEQYMRKMPGRLVGQTVDSEGKRAFCLTLQTREQHIRREKATSNVCTNQGLLALRASVYMAAMGSVGIREVAQLSYNKACYLRGELEKRGVKLRFAKAHFNELLVRVKGKVSEVIKKGDQAGMLVGYEVGKHYPELADCLLVAVTEKRTKGEMDRLVEILAG
jgi:glycine dehydrogenase subunit 1